MKTKGDRAFNRMERKNSRIEKRVGGLNKRANKITDKASSSYTVTMGDKTASIKTVDRSKLTKGQNNRVDRITSRAKTLSDKKVLSPAEAISSGKTKNLSDMKDGSRKDRRAYKSFMKNSESSKVPVGKITTGPIKSNTSQADKFNKLKENTKERKTIRLKF
jgi:hypothetical protein